MDDSRGTPEETPPIRRDRRAEKAPAEKLDPGTETDPPSSKAMTRKRRDRTGQGWNGQSTGCKGKITAYDYPSEAGGSPLS